MLDASGLNYWAILIAWIINVAIGSLWYSKAAFGQTWSKLSGVDMYKIPKKEANRAIGFVMLAGLVQAVALAIVLNWLSITSVGDGLKVGFVVWAGFAAATTVGNTLYMRLSWKFWWLNSSFYLLVILLNAAVLSHWR